MFSAAVFAVKEQAKADERAQAESKRTLVQDMCKKLCRFGHKNLARVLRAEFRKEANIR